MRNIRQKILDAAEIYLKDHSLEGAQINELCQLAGVSRTSFYREFKNLDDLFSCLISTLWTATLSEIIGASSTIASPQERLFHFSKQIALVAQSREYLPWNEQSISQAIQLLYSKDGQGLSAFTNVIAPFITGCQQDGGLRTDIRTEEISDWLLRQIWVLMSLPPTSIFNGDPLDRYIQIFIVDAMRPIDASTSGGGDVNQKLDQILDKLRYL